MAAILAITPETGSREMPYNAGKPTSTASRVLSRTSFMGCSGLYRARAACAPRQTCLSHAARPLTGKGSRLRTTYLSHRKVQHGGQKCDRIGVGRQVPKEGDDLVVEFG